jgi:hypothetical protein
MIIYHKLADIDKTSRQNYLKLTKPAFRFKRNQREIYVKNGIKVLAQENLFMLKKLITQESEYKADKFEQIYQQSRIYKNNVCRFPSINFEASLTRNSRSPLVQSYDINPKKYKVYNTEGYLPKINKNRTKFLSLQTKYAINNKELDPHYFKDAIKTNRTNKFNKSKTNMNNMTNMNKSNKKKSMKSVTEKDDDESSSNNKSNDNDDDDDSSDKKSGSKSGSENEDEKNSESGSGSGSGSGGSD